MNLSYWWKWKSFKKFLFLIYIIMIKEENQTVAQCNCVRLSSEFWEKQNSFTTSSSTSTQIDSCAKLNWWVDAVAKAQKEYRRKQILKMNKDILTWLENTEIIRKGYTNLSLYYLKRLASLSPF